MHATFSATFVRSFQECRSDAPASGFRANVEVFDAGEVTAEGDVGTEGEDEDAHHPPTKARGQHLDISGLDGVLQLPDEVIRYGFVFPKPFFQEP